MSSIKTKLVLLLFLKLLMIHAQDWTLNSSNTNGGVMPGLKIKNNEIEYFDKGLTYPTLHFNRFNLTTGQKTIDTIYYGDLLGASSTKNNGWFLLFGGKSCDTDDRMEVIELDSTQQIVNSYTLGMPYNGIPIAFPNCKTFTTNDNHFWVISPYFLYIIDPNNAQFLTKQRTLKKFGATLPLSNNKVLICGIKTVDPYVYTMSSTSSIEDSIPTPALFHFLVQANNKHWYGLAENGLYKMDSTFHSLKFHNFSSNMQPVGLKIKNDTIYAVFNSNTGPNYMQFNLNLTCLLNQFNPHKGIKVRDFELLDDQRVVFINTIETHEEKNEDCFIVRHKNIGLTLNMDIRLDKTRLINCSEKISTIGQTTSYYTRYTPEITVTNLSPLPLQSFYYNVRLYGNSFCYPRFLTDTIKTDMRPYETRTFPLKEITVNTPSSILNNLKICGFTSLPNQESDRYPLNDRLCSYKDGTPIGMKENRKMDVVAFYDQQADKVVIENVPPNSELKLIDISGKPILLLSSEEESTYFTMTSYPEGIYILQIQNNGNYHVQKIFIHH